MARTVLVAAIVALLGVAAPATAADPPTDLAGVYRCSGVNPDGTKYESVVEIVRIENTYRVMWRVDRGRAILGVGIFSNDILAVSYFAGAPAVVVYKIDGDKLVGEWVIGGKEGNVLPETLQKMPGHPPVNQPDATPDEKPDTKPDDTNPGSRIRV